MSTLKKHKSHQYEDKNLCNNNNNNRIINMEEEYQVDYIFIHSERLYQKIKRWIC